MSSITSYITTTGGVTPTTTNPLTGFSGNGFIYYVYNYNASLATQTFQLNSSYTNRLNVYYFAVSGGGGGGGLLAVENINNTGNTTYYLGGGGGGSGDYDQGTIVVEPGEIYNIVVGKGGLINTNGGITSINSTTDATDSVTINGGLFGTKLSYSKPNSTSYKFTFGKGGNSSSGNVSLDVIAPVTRTSCNNLGVALWGNWPTSSELINGNSRGAGNSTFNSEGTNRGSSGEGNYTYFRGDNSKISGVICSGGYSKNYDLYSHNNYNNSLLPGCGGDGGDMGINGIVILYFQDPAFVGDEIDQKLNTNIQIFNGTSGGGAGGAANNIDNNIYYTSQSLPVFFSDRTISGFGQGGGGGHYLAQSTNNTPFQDTSYFSLGNGGSGGHIGSALESINGGDGSPGGVIIYFPLDDLTNTNVNIGTSLTVNNNLYLNAGIYNNLTTTGTLTIPNSKFFYYPGNTIYYTTVATTYILPENLPHCYNVDISGSAATTIVLPNATANNMGQIITIYNWTSMTSNNKVNTQGSDKLYGTGTTATGVTTITYTTGFSSRIFQCGGLNKWFVISKSA